jgi:hypothetical protein
MEFPNMPTNPLDNYKLMESFKESFKESFTESTPYNKEMYFNICQGWLHCFRDPIKYIPIDKPHILISDSDFINYNNFVPDDTIKEFDFVYSCPKVSNDSTCDDWVSYNKNWELALKCLPILCNKFKLKGILIGRKDCELPEGTEEYLTTTGWLDHKEVCEYYKKSKFQFVPNQRDASPRVITEGMSYNLPLLMNYNILGGWKYVNKDTGVFFNDENDIENSIKDLLNNIDKMTPRQYLIDNYGPVNTGKRFAEFLLENFKDKLNYTDIKYVTLRNHYIE